MRSVSTNNKVFMRNTPMTELPSKCCVTFKIIDDPTSEVSKETYEKDLRKICTLESLENLMYLLCHIRDFNTIQKPFYINVFKEGIEPVWEDESNMNGCNWSLMLKREVSQRYFERLLCHLCTGSFRTFDPTGIVGIHKDSRFKLSIWSRSIPSPEGYGEVMAELKRALEIDFPVTFRYKSHSKLLEYHRAEEEK
jgi:translation initiation factor 4E